MNHRLKRREYFQKTVQKIIVPGTDAISGFTLHKELENYVRAGISEAEVLKMATIISTEVAGYANQLGPIEEGKLPDLILVEGNPLEKIKRYQTSCVDR